MEGESRRRRLHISGPPAGVLRKGKSQAARKSARSRAGAVGSGPRTIDACAPKAVVPSAFMCLPPQGLIDSRVTPGPDRLCMSQLDDIELARALHVLFVTHWIGGVAFITLVALPLASAREDARVGWALFEAIEKRFSAQVRWSIPLAGATGLWMVWRLDLWDQFGDPTFWWLDAMALIWAVFMALVFVVEPMARTSLAAEAAQDPGVLRRLFRPHVVLLSAAIVTIRSGRWRPWRPFPMTPTS